MIGKYFLLALVCFSLAQVQGDELENAIKKGLIRVEALYRRGVRRLDSVDRYQSELIQNKAAIFIEKVQRMQESSTRTLRRTAQNAEEKAQEMNKPGSVFRCIARAERNANNQIQAAVTKFRADIERMQNMYSSKVQLVSRPLAALRRDLDSRYDRTVDQIKACKTTQCVEMAARGWSMYLDRLFEAVGRIQSQISTVVSNFQREARTAFNNANRQMSMAQSTGLRQIRECVYRREVFGEEQQ